MKSLCRACNRTFGGLSGFDIHRVGQYTDTPPDYGRRCLTDEELAAKGIMPNAKGIYIKTYTGPARQEEQADAA